MWPDDNDVTSTQLGILPGVNYSSGFGALGSTTQGGVGSLLGSGGAALGGSDLLSSLRSYNQGSDSGLGTSLGPNIGTAQLGLGALGALAGIWGAYNSNKLANEQFKFTKQTTNTNLNNQIKSYNTTLSDRIAARAAMEGKDQAYVDDYLAKNKLTR